MISSGIDPQLVAKQADSQDLIRFKQEMDGLKGRLAGDGADKSKQLRSACENFEAVFISKLWKEMKSTIPKEGYLHSKQEDQYMSMFDRDFAEKMAKDGGIGLADMIYEQLSQKLKDTSKDTLGGSVQIKALHGGPMALNKESGGLALPVKQEGITLEDWGGAENTGSRQQEIITSEQIVSGLADKKAANPIMNDIDVKAQLEALTRRLEAERIKDGLLGSTSVGKARSYGNESETKANVHVGRRIAEIG